MSSDNQNEKQCQQQFRLATFGFNFYVNKNVMERDMPLEHFHNPIDVI